MPAVRNTRRSRRLSDKNELDRWEDVKLDLRDRHLVDPASSSGGSPCPSPAGSSPPNSSSSSLGDTSSPALSEGFVHRSSHSRKQKPGHIPRPPNPFMIYRSHLCHDLIKETVERDHRQISKIAGSCWRNLPEKERLEYKQKAEKKKQEHAKAYPSYKFSPVSRKGKSSGKKTQPNAEAKVARSETVAALIEQGIVGDELEDVMKRLDAGEEYLPLSSSSSPVSAKPLAKPTRSRPRASKAKPKAKARCPRRIETEPKPEPADESEGPVALKVEKPEPWSPELVPQSPPPSPMLGGECIFSEETSSSPEFDCSPIELTTELSAMPQVEIYEQGDALVTDDLFTFSYGHDQFYPGYCTYGAPSSALQLDISPPYNEDFTLPMDRLSNSFYGLQVSQETFHPLPLSQHYFDGGEKPLNSCVMDYKREDDNADVHEWVPDF